MVSYFQGQLLAQEFLKERKRTRERKNPPCTPLIKKGSVEKGQKTLSPVGRESDAVEVRKKEFWAELEQFVGKYDREMVLKFFYYWAEEMKGLNQMRWEIQKSWNTSYRLAAWSKKSYDKDDKAAALRLNRAKQKSATKSEATEQQVAIARERMIENERREQETAEAKKNAVSMEDYLKEHPDSNLRMFKK